MNRSPIVRATAESLELVPAEANEAMPPPVRWKTITTPGEPYLCSRFRASAFLGYFASFLAIDFSSFVIVIRKALPPAVAGKEGRPVDFLYFLRFAIQ